MGFYKLVGAVLLALSGVAGAVWMNRRSSMGLRQADGFLALLRYVRNQVECFALPVSEILRRCDPRVLSECGYASESVPRRMEELVEACRVEDRETVAYMARFSAEFGRCYRDEQVQSCEYYCSLLLSRRNALAGELPGKKKLHSTLCVSGALAMVILLI